ncbi:uncharacterized protein MYCGRDRAFT_89704 [Zymoseptoria tritici IPO323]|uniref:Uncharacterized protein n=1 Tax=Zymoseptoria tritici (strain CBS 115943 / IPO323) TaxID=336722 RepID=F9X179_ZYMTI|nr:uncharacterized protein MYCGRDRAFT_89704 [Zymoseptoria tritici IPO323]EGP92170.1 hypothetical protein MYCGRDRAFT_89704 [Zymoseptoria tritici IPO323]
MAGNILNDQAMPSSTNAAVTASARRAMIMRQREHLQITHPGCVDHQNPKDNEAGNREADHDNKQAVNSDERLDTKSLWDPAYRQYKIKQQEKNHEELLRIMNARTRVQHAGLVKDFPDGAAEKKASTRLSRMKEQLREGCACV